MSDFARYMESQTKRKEAFARFCQASVEVELAYIKERLAEIKSQHMPLENLINDRMSERERLYAAAHYVVVGRMPDKTERGDE